MLESLDGWPVNEVWHRADFDALVRRLAGNADAVREYLDVVIDQLPPDRKTGQRVLDSSILGARLTPWPEPLRQLYLHSREFLGQQASEDEVQSLSSLWFGLFVCERLVMRDETWKFWNQKLASTDPNTEPVGMVYFEQEASV